MKFGVKCMKTMTERALKEAFAGESQAHVRYLIFAEEAEKRRFENIARLFRAIAFSEYIHAKNHLKALGGIKETVDNLQAAINGETFEVEEMYPAYSAVAETQGEREAQRVIKWALEAEKIHASLYEKAKSVASEKRDISIGKIYVCERCGYTVEGGAPERCPVCGAPKERFKEF